MQHKPSAKGTTIRARSTKTVLVRCWETPTDSGSWNFTKHTREVTGKGESLKENINTFARCTHSVHTPPAQTLELTLTIKPAHSHHHHHHLANITDPRSDTCGSEQIGPDQPTFTSRYDVKPDVFFDGWKTTKHRTEVTTEAAETTSSILPTWAMKSSHGNLLFGFL